MTIFRFRAALLAFCGAAHVSGVSAQPVNPLMLEPLPGDDAVTSTTVRNIYGHCGSAVVQVLGLAQQQREFFSVDSAAGNADVVVIGAGHQLSLKGHMSDYNGVACIETREGKRLVTWSDCSGSACGSGYSFVVINPDTLKIEAGEESVCNSLCASRALGSDIPLKLDGLALNKDQR